MSNVFRKLQTARVTLQGRKLVKSGRNDFANYDYFTLEDFLPSVQEIFDEIGLCGVVTFSYEGCSLSIHNLDDPKEAVVFISPWSESNMKQCQPIQNLGAAETYQRRYLWVTALEIVEHDALDSTTGSQEKEEMVMTNRLVPKHYWDATDEIAKDKIIGAGNSIKKNDADKKWYICEPVKKDGKTIADVFKEAIDKADPMKHDDVPNGQIQWTCHVEKVTQKSTTAGVAYWEIETEAGNCYCKNKQLVEELQMMGGEEVILVVQKNVRKGTYELFDFEGALA